MTISRVIKCEAKPTWDRRNNLSFYGMFTCFETVNNETKYLWSQSTGIRRSTIKDALFDARADAKFFVDTDPYPDAEVKIL